MDSNSHEEITEESEHKIESNSAPIIPRLKEYRIQIPSLHERLLEHQRSIRKRRFFDFLRARPSLSWIKNMRFSSPLAVFRRAVHRREEISLGVPSPAGVRRRFHIHFIRKINFSSLLTISKEWLSHPMNAALLLWLICVAVSGIMLGLLMLGLLNEAFPKKALRNRWIEINNQILNALFTLMSIYQHPVIFHHLYILCRWRSEDIVELRKIYCKDGAHRPNEWAHMMVVIILLHITCIAQYALCAVYWSFTSFNRPEVLEYLFIALGVAAPVCAGGYAIYSPLGREYESNSDEELQNSMNGKVGLKLNNGKRVLVSEPEWIGGLFDCFSDVPVAYLSCCCTCCVFGWNMERLGFGNMYVHIVTFLLLCLAPFWIFNISAMKIRDYVIGDVLGISGIVLCVFGLIYGGFWRSQMRKRFKLPESRLCCVSASLSDYMKWMFCWSCALAQEVRTGNFYDVEDDNLFRRPSEDERQPLLNSFMSESGSSAAASISFEADLENLNVVEVEEINTSLIDPNARNEAIHSLEKVEDLNEEESLVVSVDDRMMVPPVQPLMKVKGEVEDESTSLVVRDAGDEPVLPLVNAEDGMSNEDKGSFVRMMEFGLFFVVVIMYTMGSIIVH